MAGLHNRPFVGRRFRCSTIRHDGTVCGGFGEPTIEPPERRRINETLDTELVFLFCRRLGDAGNLTGEAWRRKPVKLSASSSGHNLHTQRWPGLMHSDCHRTQCGGTKPRGRLRVGLYPFTDAEPLTPPQVARRGTW
jgi:hypothetical protein